MNRLVGLCFFLFPLIVSAQQNLAVETFLGMGLSKVPNSFTDQFFSQEATIVGRYGVGLTISLNKRFTVRTGLQLTDYGFQREVTYGFVTSLGMVPGVEIPPVTTRYLERSVENLLVGQYLLMPGRRFCPYLEAGILLNFYVDSRIRLQGDVSPLLRDELSEFLSARRDSFVHTINAVARVGGGVKFLLSDRCELFSGLHYQRYLITFNAEGPAKIFPWRMDVELGGRWFFGSSSSSL